MKKFLPAVLAFFGCGSSNNASTEVLDNTVDWEEASKVEYRFGDSSVAPQCHRSYLITITDSSKSIVIDSYGDVLLTKQYPNTPSEFQFLKEELSKKGISKHKMKDSRGCAGGTTETLRLYNGETKFFDAYVYHCSGESGTLFLPNGTADLIRSQIPESVELLIKSTMRNNIQ